MLRELWSFCASRGLEAFLVGGAVRDALLGRQRADIDIALRGDVEEFVQALGEALPVAVVALDRERHVYRLVARQRTCHIDIAPLRGGSLSADSDWRDFTIDALALPLAQLQLEPRPEELAGAIEEGVVDTVGGIEDLRRGHIRAIKDTVFIDDPIRLLRAVRLAAERGFAIEPHTQELIRRDAGMLNRVSNERIRDEFCLILAAPGVRTSLRLLDSLGLLTAVVPELEQGRNVEQPKEHHWDVLQHSIEAAGHMEEVLRIAPGDPETLRNVPWDESMEEHFSTPVVERRTRAVLAKLGALLHDVAKPATKTIEDDGRIRFLGHPVKGADMTAGIMERLRFSTRETRIVTIMVNEHLRPGLISRGEHEPTRRALYRFFRDTGEAMEETMFLCFADYLAAKGPEMEPPDWERYTAKMRHILTEWKASKSASPRVRLIDGHDLMNIYRLRPGPQLRVLLEAVKEGQATGEITSRDEALALIEKMLGESRAA